MKKAYVCGEADDAAALSRAIGGDADVLDGILSNLELMENEATTTELVVSEDNVVAEAESTTATQTAPEPGETMISP